MSSEPIIYHNDTTYYSKKEYNKLQAKLDKAVKGLKSISLNSCCDQCQEAKLVALKILKEVE